MWPKLTFVLFCLWQSFTNSSCLSSQLTLNNDKLFFIENFRGFIFFTTRLCLLSANPSVSGCGSFMCVGRYNEVKPIVLLFVALETGSAPPRLSSVHALISGICVPVSMKCFPVCRWEQEREDKKRQNKWKKAAVVDNRLEFWAKTHFVD